MASHDLATVTPRIGKLMGEILAHAMPQEVIGRIGVSMKKRIPKNKSETVVFRRWLPKGATSASPNTWSVTPESHMLGEGETPVGESITAQDIQVSLIEYGVLYRYSNRTADLYEDDVPGAMKKLTGERMGLVLELVRYGQLKAGTNVYRAGNVASRSLVTALISVNLLRNVARGLYNNLAAKCTNVLSGSPDIGTQPIEAAYIVVCHTDVVADLRATLGTDFVHVSAYGQRRPIHPNEVGSTEDFRFVVSPHMAPYLNAGTTATANTRLAGGVANSAGSELVDVYPLIVMAEECFGDVMLRGMESFDVTDLRPGQKTKDDPLGQRGYIGASTYYNAVRLNEGHLAIVEVAVSSL